MLAASPGAADAATPAPIWRDVNRLAVLCNVGSDSVANLDTLRTAICDLARDTAAAGAPVPVEIVAPGDPSILAADTVALLVHAFVENADDGHLIALSTRIYRNDPGEAQQLFGAAPRAVLVPARGDPAAQIAQPLAAALAETIPWLARPRGPRRLDH